MSYSVRFTAPAREDLLRLVAFLVERDPAATAQARAAIGEAVSLLERFPLSCRMPDVSHPRIRELLIPFGRSGYVALFEIDDAKTVTLLAFRHQHEDDYF
ncbi:MULTISPECIES: type II toxin-antitoxin system RelE/ParE family toxin [unclassified Thioalkalivibrio]|uniref:type II toxin-antitoxin system RelE/ParE family toxin n=1 Tax=unclassified Thioalkalivibrio TaxID=2621013 RepID=UPI000365B6E2|nr:MULTISPECIES: type II toxin-antitoxin system RelE/ParE family toxin [unclassified Thioalkalivibrio]